MEDDTIRTLESGEYILAMMRVRVAAGRSGAVIIMGSQKVSIDSSLPQADGTWRVRYTLYGQMREGILTAAT